MVTFCTPITLKTCNTIFTRALPIGLVAELSTNTHRMTVTQAARFLVCHGIFRVSIKAFLAVMAVPTRCVIPALVADTSWHPTKQSLELHVKPTTPSMKIAVTCYTFVGRCSGCHSHGWSKWNGLHFSHSRPSLLCKQSQISSPNLSKLHLNAWPLHLHRPPSPIARSDTPMCLL